MCFQKSIFFETPQIYQFYLRDYFLWNGLLSENKLFQSIGQLALIADDVGDAETEHDDFANVTGHDYWQEDKYMEHLI